MSVSQKPQAPHVPDWDYNEILQSLKDRYSLETEQEWIDEFGMGVSAMISAAEELEPGQPDMDRQMEFLEMYSDVDENYQSNHWINESDAKFRDGAKGKVIYYGVMRDPENEDCWIMISETEYVEDDS